MELSSMAIRNGYHTWNEIFKNRIYFKIRQIKAFNGVAESIARFPYTSRFTRRSVFWKSIHFALGRDIM